MLKVKLAGQLRDAVDGAASINLEAASIRELFRELVERYPDMQGRVEEGLAVSINGEIYRDNWAKPIPANAEIYLLQRIPGG